MKSLIQFTLFCLLIFAASSCKEVEEIEPEKVILKDKELSLSVGKASDIYKDESLVSLTADVKFTDEIKFLKLIFSESQDFMTTTDILDTSFFENQKEFQISEMFMLKRYASNKLWFRLEVTDIQDSTYSQDTFITYRNVIYQNRDVDLTYTGYGCSTYGFNFTEMKGKRIYCEAGDNDIVEFDALYKEPTSNNSSVILTKGDGNKTQYSFIDFESTPDSLISVDMVESKLSSLTFTESLNFGTYLQSSKWVVIKLDDNIHNKPWALLRVRSITSFSSKNGTTFTGRIKGETFDYPTNY